METTEKLRLMMDEELHLNGSSSNWTSETRLLGSLPELDSMAVVAVISGIQSTFCFPIYDDEISAEIFATFGSLTMFVDQKLATL